MSSPYLPPRPPTPPPRPASARPAASASAAKGPGGKVPWGWLEWIAISQTFLPALLFVPGSSPLRTPIRIAAYMIAPLAWYFVAKKGKPQPGSDTFPAIPWLSACSIWLGLSIFHPNSYSLVAATAQVALYVSVLSPAFWAPAAMTSVSQIRRLMAIFLLCNALSAIVGILQVFKPGTFNPPVIPAMNNQFGGEDLMYESGGMKIMRPCGLTDSPGGAAPAGMAAALIGLCWALLPIKIWLRAGCIFLALAGVAVIFYTQVRFTLVMLAICVMALTGLLLMQRDVRKASLLTSLGGGLLVLALSWVAMSGGDAVTKRFMSLVEEDPGSVYKNSRGGFIQEAFDEILWAYPVGYGLGWWGMMYAIFGSPSRPSPIWCEVMIPAWMYDGGMPLFVGYVGALAVTMMDLLRVAFGCPDKELAYWAAVVFAFNLSILASCFSFVAFLSPFGIPYWLLAASVHAADARVRLARKGGIAPA